MTEKVIGPVMEYESLGEQEVAVGLAETVEQQVGRLSVVTDRYDKQGYLVDVPSYDLEAGADELITGGMDYLRGVLDPDIYERFLREGVVFNLKNGVRMYLDKYHWQSVGFVAVTREGYVGSARLVFLGEFGLPTQEDGHIVIDPEYAERASGAQAEFSQFAKLKSTHPGVAVALLRAAYQYSKSVGVEEWLATTDNFVIRLLNGAYFNFALPRIGETVFYLGSDSTPVWIDLEKALDSAYAKETSRDMSRFIRGERPEGFEWFRIG
ncbi:hypothetical protein JW766_04525 [Candidatus Dojkabacteria bacterium]|nr:hypothetical protein [Candidatus Dojkabacteria bacterium]